MFKYSSLVEKSHGSRVSLWRLFTGAAPCPHGWGGGGQMKKSLSRILQDWYLQTFAENQLSFGFLQKLWNKVHEINIYFSHPRTIVHGNPALDVRYQNVKNKNLHVGCTHHNQREQANDRKWFLLNEVIYATWSLKYGWISLLVSEQVSELEV